MNSKEGSDNESIANPVQSVRSHLNQELNQSQELNPMVKVLGENLRLKLRRTNTKLSGGGGGTKRSLNLRLTNR
jgi:hypothetical protein